MSYIGKTPTSVPLTSSDITDGIISLPKLTDGTDGNIISYDASGNPVAVATGTDGQVLTSAGAGAPPAFEALPTGGTNTPAFLAYLSSNQSVTASTTTKVTIDTEVYDTDNAYDNSTNYRFTPQVAGKYFVYGNIFHSWNTNHGWQQKTIIRKNGTDIATWSNLSNGIGAGQYGSMYTSTTVAMNGSTDYLELFGSFNATSPFFAAGLDLTYFGAYKIIE